MFKYIYGVIASAFAVLMALLFYRGKKIDSQKEKINDLESEAITKEFESKNELEAEKAKHVEADKPTPGTHYL